MTVLLVRHGESEGNAQRIIQGSLNTSLTDLGRRQALAVASRLAAEPVAAVYGTPLRRAADTARAIATSHDLEVAELAQFSERVFGEAQGLTWEQASQRWSAVFGHDWWGGIPGVEPLADFRARAVEGLNALLDRHEGEIAVAVTHGGTIGQLVAHALDMGVEDWPRIAIGNTSVTMIERQRGVPVIALLNDLCHLREVDQTAPPPA
jgi:broad specificity phosphatase PhoE